MSAITAVPRNTPRDPGAAILQRSQLRPTFGRRVFVAETLFCAWHALLATRDSAPDTIAGWVAAMIVWALLSVWVWHHPDRLRETWQSGKLSEATIEASYLIVMFLSICRVEHAGKRAWVLLRGEPTRGQRLAALVQGGWIAVVDGTERLRIARLRDHR